MDLLIGLDVGTSAIKGVLFTTEGELVAKASTSTELVYPEPGFKELDPEEHYRALCSTVKGLAEKAPEEGKIRALSMAAASGNSLMLDSEFKPIINIVSWMDNRAFHKREETLPGLDYNRVGEISGWPWTDSFPLQIFAWYKKYRPEVYKKAAWFCQNNDYLMYRLTGKWGLDPSTGTTFFLIDQKTGRYYKPYLDALGITEEQVAPVYPSGTALGTLTPEAAEETGLSGDTQVVLGAFDHPSAARGTGNLNAGDLLLSCGTSWVGFYVLEERQKAVKVGFLVDPFLAPEGPWSGMVSIPYIGQSVEWYASHAVLEKGEAEEEKWRIFSEKAAAAPRGAGGLYLAPYYDLTNNQPEDRREFPPDIGPGQVARAVMEGIAFEMKTRMDNYAKAGIPAERITMVGGPSESPIWPQIVSDVTGLELRLVGGQAAGAVGAAILAGIGAGIFKDERDGYRRMGSEEQRVVKPSPQAQGEYSKIYKEYQKAKAGS
jgi:sugar (pentulose or hexulose) kinase